jgi:hypothetical protein
MPSSPLNSPLHPQLTLPRDSLVFNAIPPPPSPPSLPHPHFHSALEDDRANRVTNRRSDLGGGTRAASRLGGFAEKRLASSARFAHGVEFTEYRLASGGRDTTAIRAPHVATIVRREVPAGLATSHRPAGWFSHSSEREKAALASCLTSG